MIGQPGPEAPLPVIVVTLDGQAVGLSTPELRSLATVRAGLERMALRQERVLVGLRVDGVPVSLAATSTEWTGFRQVEARSISFQQLGHKSIAAVQGHLPQLRERVESLSLLVMINDWPVVERLWQELLPELRLPVQSLQFLADLLGRRLARLQYRGVNLAAHLERLTSILDSLNESLAQQDALGLSDKLEQRLLPWLAQLELLLLQWHEH